MKKSDVMLTVFTPTYNRAYTLHKCYESLKSQECKDFKWLIIDDGSSDNTRELVESWILQNNDFEIQYVYKTNGGMHTAHNKAYEIIDTELNVCIDSDDYVAEGAISKIVDFWKSNRQTNVAGIIGLDADFSNSILGEKFDENIKKTTLGGYYVSGGRGDKKLVYRTDIINNYPVYPEFKGEKYVSLGYKYLLCDQDYELLVLNEVLCNVEYLPDGSSVNMFSQYFKNPKGFAFFRKTAMVSYPSTRRCFIECVHYVSESLISKNVMFLFESPRKMMTLLSIPFGLAFFAYISFKSKKQMRIKD